MQSKPYIKSVCVCVCIPAFQPQHIWRTAWGWVVPHREEPVTQWPMPLSDRFWQQAESCWVMTLTWRDLMKVHRRFRIPSERFKSFTRRITRNSLKNVIETLMFSEDFSERERADGTLHSANYLIQPNSNLRRVNGTHRNCLHGINCLQKQTHF